MGYCPKAPIPNPQSPILFIKFTKFQKPYLI
jgi:hypothetical protein